WPKWKERTSLTPVPFPAVAVTAETSSPWKTSEAAEAVSTFMSNFWALSEAEQVNYIRCLPDNDTKGRDLWLGFFNAHWRHWKVISTVDAILAERALDPYSIMRRMRISNLPELATSQITLAYPSLGETLFGVDAFTEDRIALKEPVRRFLDNLMVHRWSSHRKSIQRERVKLEPCRAKVQQAWKELIRTWLKSVEGLTKILTRYGDKESLKNLTEQRETL
ncbi:hypothetical protein BDR07DRAFT_1234335, partial [Suillus spraguei]